jgi:hypothetical protein
MSANETAAASPNASDPGKRQHVIGIGDQCDFCFDSPRVCLLSMGSFARVDHTV